MSSPKILLTGSTGFIGGSILTKLVESGITAKYPVSVIVRGEDKAKALKAKYGVKTYLFHSLDEADLLREIAGEHDIVIHPATGFHTASAKALVLGLGDRKKKTGNKVHYIHKTGTSNLADQPVTKTYLESRTFSDKEDIYSYLQQREALQEYAQRTTDLTVIDTGLVVNVPTTLLMSPTIYGVGTGIGNNVSIQVPTIIRSSLKEGYVSVISDGEAVWDFVHIDDVVDLYLIILQRVLNGEEVPTGKSGIIFTGSGRFHWKDLSEGVADALFAARKISTAELKHVMVIEAAEKWAGGWAMNAELAFGSNSRTTADTAFELGWKPQKTEEDFKNHYAEQVRLITQVESQK